MKQKIETQNDDIWWKGNKIDEDLMLCVEKEYLNETFSIGVIRLT